MKRQIPIVASFLIIHTVFFVLPQFHVMPREKSDLLRINAASATENATGADQDGTDPLRIVVRKSRRTLEIHKGGKIIKSYGVVLGSAPEGDKEVEGDGRTPEGEFYIFTKNPKSKFHLSIGVSYPSIEDAIRGLNEGLITREEHDVIVRAVSEKKMPPQKTRLGGEIYIHGGGIGADWTQGCVAMRNAEIEELFNSIPVGTPVTITP